MTDLTIAEPRIVKDRGAAAERWGGWLISVCLHIAFFALLLNFNAPVRDYRGIDETPAVRIVLAAPEPETPEDTPPDPDPAHRMENVRSTTAENPASASRMRHGVSPEIPPEGDPRAEESATDSIQVISELTGESEEVPAPAELSPQTDDRMRRSEHLRHEEDLVRELRERSRRGELTPRGTDTERREEIDMRLKEIEIDQSAKRWLTTTEGQAEGVIRSLDTMGVPQTLAEEVLGRYGIRIYVDVMDGKGSTMKFLNEARTSQGTYLNEVGRGMFQIFSIPQSAVGRMMRMEVREMERRGMDPARTRVLEVEYGIIRVPGGYDLGITQFKAVPDVIEKPR